MALSTIDFISPKITLYYNGRSAHISQIGGILSLFLASLICTIIFYIIWDILINPKIISSFVYDKYINDKIYFSFNNSELNHFMQIYSNTDNGWFGDYDNKNIIVYSIKENQTSSFDNLNLEITEHWVYDKCKAIFEIDKYFFSEISKKIPNYDKSICLRFYYNPNTKQYYEIGFKGYVHPTLETNKFFERKNTYKIIIEKCFNNSFIINKFGYICNNEIKINNYLNIYSTIFNYFSNNQIIPLNYKSPLENYIDSISSNLNNNSYFESNIFFSPIKLLNDKNIFPNRSKDQIVSFILDNHFSSNNIVKKENSKIIGIFNFYLKNSILIYQRRYLNIFEAISHLGGMVKILFFLFELINYLNYSYTVLEHIRKLFNISTGIDINMNNIDENEFILDKKHNINNLNYKIKVFNNNNIINTDDINYKMMKNYYTRTQDNKKKVIFGQEQKNLGKINNNNNLIRNNDDFLGRRSQTKYMNNANQMGVGKQLTIRNRKRQSYLSQGYHLYKADRGDNSILSKNHSVYDDINNEKKSFNYKNIFNNSNTLFLKETALKYDSAQRISQIKRESKKAKINKKINPKKPSNENITHLLIKNLDSNKGRHKSVNFTNQKKLLDNNYSLNNKFSFFGKHSSGFINDSSKQILVNNSKLPLIAHNNKLQFEKKIDNYSRIPSLINNNNEIYTNNITTNAINNSNMDPSLFLKNIVHSKIKFCVPEFKRDTNYFGNFEKSINYLDFIKSLFVFYGKKENKICLLNNFRNKLLSEEHIYRVFINLYLIEKIFQIDEAYKFDINELYNNL